VFACKKSRGSPIPKVADHWWRLLGNQRLSRPTSCSWLWDSCALSIPIMDPTYSSRAMQPVEQASLWGPWQAEEKQLLK